MFIENAARISHFISDNVFLTQSVLYISLFSMLSLSVHVASDSTPALCCMYWCCALCSQLLPDAARIFTYIVQYRIMDESLFYILSFL